MLKSYRWYAAALVLVITVGLSVRSWVAAGDPGKDKPSNNPFGGPPKQKIAVTKIDRASLAPPLFKIDLKAKPVLENDPAIEKQINAALDKRHDVDFNEVPLKDFIEHLRKQSGIQIMISDKALADAAVPSDTPITFAAKNITLRSALRLSLRPLQLNYIVRDGVLLITTQSSADQHLVIRVYPVVDLATPFDVKAAENDDQLDYDSLIELITSTVAPTTWDSVGGPGSIIPINGTLPISQTQEVHEQIEALLSALRKVSESQQKKLGGDSVTAVEHAAHGEAANSISKVLQQPVELAFDETELGEAIGMMAETSGLNIVLDQKALADAAIATDTPITRSIRGVSFESALNVLLEPLEMTWLIRDEVLLITTRAEADQRLEIRVYPVGDALYEQVRSSYGFHTCQFPSDNGNYASLDFDSLIETITSTIAPTTWDSVGGPGAVSAFETNLSLVISQTPAIHRRIERLLADVRAKQHKFEPKSAERIKADDEKFELQVYILPTKPLPVKEPAVAQPVAQKPASPDVRPQIGNITKQPRHGGNFGGYAFPDTRYEAVALTPQSAAMLIRDLVEPTSWKADEVFVRAVDDRLIIRQTVSVHRKIDEMLGQLGVPGYPRLRFGELPNENNTHFGCGGGGFGGGSR